MKKFEYMVVEGDSMIYNIELDAFGQGGWELCCVAWGCAIFKREIPQE